MRRISDAFAVLFVLWLGTPLQAKETVVDPAESAGGGLKNLIEQAKREV